MNEAKSHLLKEKVIAGIWNSTNVNWRAFNDYVDPILTTYPS